VLRFAALSTNPGSLYGDEASEGLDALRLLHQPGFHADWFVWFESDGGREALFAYVVAAAFSILGESALVLRETAAAFGVAGVAAVAILARRWGNGAALAAGAWAAGSLWLICVSRDGMRNTIVPFFGAVALIALLRWAARPGRATAVAAGAVTSLAALYTYQPLKLLPVLVVAWLWWLRRADRPRYDELRPGFGPAAIAFLAVGAPMLAVAITNPINYFGHATAVSVFNPAVVSDVPYPIHIVRTILMFGFFGDGNGRHDVASLPLLPIPLTLVALFGLARLWRGRRDPADSLILMSLPIFMLPPLLFPDGYSPHFLRALGLAAPLGVTIGLGAVELVDFAGGRWGRRASLAASALVAVTLSGVAVWSGFVYMDRSLADRWEPYSFAPNEMARLALEQPDQAVVIGGFDLVDVEFADYGSTTAIFDPSTPIPDPAGYSRILALSRSALAGVVGSDLAATAVPVVFDPWGQPAVWAVTP
jgi:4-amino-4-deoxy-L-arabinose transferase-like glycosyltransferase